jgi:hypothetical protein
VAAGIALGLGLPEGFFVHAPDSYWVARVIHYPPLAEGAVHASPHGPSAEVLAEKAAEAAKGAEVGRAVQLRCALPMLTAFLLVAEE